MRLGRTIIVGQIYSSGIFYKVDIDAGTIATQTIQSYLYGDFVSYNGFLYMGNFNNPVYNMRKINKTTFAVTSTSAITSTLIPNATNPGITAVYNGKIICSTYAQNGAAYFMIYDPVADSWSNVTSTNATWQTPNNTHLDAANGYLYFLQSSSFGTGALNLYRCSASDLSGISHISTFNNPRNQVFFMRIVGDVCYVLSGDGGNANFYAYRVSTGANLATIGGLLGTGIGSGIDYACIIDTDRNLAYISCSYTNYLQVIDLATYTIKSKPLLTSVPSFALYARHMFSDYDNPKFYY